MNTATNQHSDQAIRENARKTALLTVELGGIDRIDPKRLRAQILRSRITAVVGFLTMICVFGYVVWGPELTDPHDATFAAFLFLVGFSFFTIGIFTASLPLWMAMVQGKLRAIRDESHLIDAEMELDRSEKKREEVTQKACTLLRIVEEARTAGDRGLSVSPIFERHEAEIAEIRSELATTAH